MSIWDTLLLSTVWFTVLWSWWNQTRYNEQFNKFFYSVYSVGFTGPNALFLRITQMASSHAEGLCRDWSRERGQTLSPQSGSRATLYSWLQSSNCTIPHDECGLPPLGRMASGYTQTRNHCPALLLHYCIHWRAPQFTGNQITGACTQTGPTPRETETSACKRELISALFYTFNGINSHLKVGASGSSPTILWDWAEGATCLQNRSSLFLPTPMLGSTCHWASGQEGRREKLSNIKAFLLF